MNNIQTSLDIVGGGTVAHTGAFKTRAAMTSTRQTNGDNMTSFEALVAWSYGCMIERFASNIAHTALMAEIATRPDRPNYR